MEHLPLETKEKILLQASPEDISSLCHASSDFYLLCGDPLFWKKRFIEDGFEFLEEGKNPQEWLNIYQALLDCKKIINIILETQGRSRVTFFTLYLDTYLDPFLFTAKGENGSIEEEEVRSIFLRYNRLWKKRGVAVVEDYYYREHNYPHFLGEEPYTPPEGRDYFIEVSAYENKPYFPYYSFAGKKINLSYAELEKLLYKLCYFNVLKAENLALY